MARTATEYLMAQGYSAEQIATLVKDPIMVKMVDQAISEQDRLVAENENIKGVLKRTEDWYNTTAIPEVEKARRAAVTAQAEKARLEAQLKAETEMGLRRVGEGDQYANANQPSQQNQPGQQPNQPPAQPEIDARYVTQDSFKQVADQVGDGMARMADLADEHQELFGKRLPGGVSKLRADWLAARQNQRYQGDMMSYWRDTYKVEDRRTELATKAKQEEEARIRADERQKVASEQLNPHTSTWQSSRAPFARKVANGTSEGSGKMPWETSREERTAARVLKFGQKELAQRTA